MGDTSRIAETDPAHWKYISEGGSTIVFSYTGPPRAELDGTVLRLRKSELDESLSTGLVNDENAATVFHETVISRLVPAQYLPRLEQVAVEHEWLVKLAQLCQERRPASRRAKDVIDVRYRTAVLATDLVGGPGWAVEIKPKWGFLPSPAYLSPATHPLKTHTCRFCMHAHLKSTQGDVAATRYCPLDLYCGEETCARRALHALWDDWIGSSGRINNLRIFVEGELLRPVTELSALDALARQLEPSFSSRSALSLTDLRDRFTTALLPLLSSSPVLTTISTLQRTLDELDIEGLSALWSRAHAVLHESIPALGAGSPQPTIDEWTHVIDEYLHRNSAQRDTEKEPQVRDLRYYCLAYLLSTTFKDCSIIVRLRPNERRSEAHDGADKFGCSVTVIDLDVKSISRLDKWAKQDREIVEAYAKADRRRECHVRHFERSGTL